MNRDDFYARVRTAAHAGRAYRVHIDPNLPVSMGYVGGGDDLPARLAAEIVGVGGQAKLVDDLNAARVVLGDLLAQFQPQSALCWQHPLLDRLDLAALLGERGVTLRDFASLHDIPNAARREQMIAADIGISSCSYAVAETGTLAMYARPGQERLASLLPPVHVAIVERAQILPDLFDLFGALQHMADTPDGLPSNVACITGPSKTGDIELTLTTGVHGPGEWHVIIVR